MTDSSGRCRLPATHQIALPAERNAKLWAERTTDGFVFNVKPFALMTQHPAEMSRLPEQLREMVPAEDRSDRLTAIVSIISA